MGERDPANSPDGPRHPFDTALPWLIAGIAAVWVLAGTRAELSYGDTLFSRLATVYALVHHGTFAIDPIETGLDNPFAERTVDKVQMGGRIVSSKPPVLPLMMTAEYIVMNRLAGWRLDDEAALSRVAWIMTVTFVGIPFVVMAWAVTRAVQYAAPGAAGVAFLGLATVIGTHAGALAVVFNNHVPAASAVVLCAWLSLRMLSRPGSPARTELMSFGTAAGFAATIDIPTAVFPALCAVAIARRHLVPLLAWAAPPAITLLAIQTVTLYFATGSPLPVQLHPEAYLYENSYWRNPLGVDALNNPPLLYLFHITFGRVGVFSLFPVTLLAVAGLFAIRRVSMPYRAVTACAAAGAAVITLYYGLTTNNYGGAAFGCRWLAVLGPILLIVAAPIFARFQRPWHWVVPFLLLAVSAYSAWQCASAPWRPNAEWTVRVYGPSL